TCRGNTTNALGRGRTSLEDDASFALDGLLDAVQEFGRYLFGEALFHDDPEPLFEGVALEAGSAVGEVTPDASAPPPRELVVDVEIYLLERLLTGWLHGASAPSGTRPLRLANSHNARWSCLLPRWSLDMTVPMGMSRISAISL